MHAATQEIDLEEVCASAGVNYINPSGGVEYVLAGIQGSEMVIAEAMHGAIVADALGIPWVPVRIYSQILALKWWDWCKSLGLEYNPRAFIAPAEPATLGASPAAELERFLQRTASEGHPLLSDRGLLDAATSRLQELLQGVRSGRLTGCVTGSAELAIDPEVFREVPWLHEMHLALKEIASVVPPGASLILVDDQQWGGGEVLGGRRTIPFLERDGQYWGPPPDDDTAIRELERLRAVGADYIVFVRTSFWWLDHYSRLHRYLRSSFPCALENDRLAVFKLQPEE
jgi:hypothetical protein